MKQPNMSKKEHMKMSILLSVAVIISLVFVLYGQIKANEVEELKVQLEEVQLENGKLKDEAVALMEKALEMAAIGKQAETEALKQKNIADRALLELQECKSK